jgi:cytochrome P450 family 4
MFILTVGLKWSSHRKYLQPTFKTNILEKFIVTFVDSSSCLVERLKNGPPIINVAPFVNDCVLAILNGKGLSDQPIKTIYKL